MIRSMPVAPAPNLLSLPGMLRDLPSDECGAAGAYMKRR